MDWLLNTLQQRQRRYVTEEPRAIAYICWGWSTLVVGTRLDLDLVVLVVVIYMQVLRKLCHTVTSKNRLRKYRYVWARLIAFEIEVMGINFPHDLYYLPGISDEV